MTYRLRNSDHNNNEPKTASSTRFCSLGRRRVFLLLVLLVLLISTAYVFALFGEISPPGKSSSEDYVFGERWSQWLGASPSRPPVSDSAAETDDADSGEEFGRLTTDIDIVYTWVNGSDPRQLESLKTYKLAHIRSDEAAAGGDKHEQFVQVEFDAFMAELQPQSPPSNTTTTPVELGDRATRALTEPQAVWPCYHKYCVQKNNMFIIQPQLRSDEKKSVLSYVKKLRADNDVHLVSLEEHQYLSDRANGSQVWLNATLMIIDVDKASAGHSGDLKPEEARAKVFESLRRLFKATFMRSPGTGHKVFMAYYTVDCSLSPNCLRNVEGSYVVRLGDGTAPPTSTPVSWSSRLDREVGSHLLKEDVETSESDLPFYIAANVEFRMDFRHLPPRYEVASDANSKDKNKAEKVKKEQAKAESRLSVFKTKKAALVEYLEESFRVKQREEEYDELNDSRADSQDQQYAETLSLFEQRVSANRNATKSDDPLARLEAQLADPLQNRTIDNLTSIRNYELYKASIVWDLGDPFYDDVAPNRFNDNDELKYSLRSLEMYAPWFRNLYIVTNGQVPSWLNLSHPKVRLVTHEEIFLNKSHLPTFSSPAIESHLHRIKGLSKRFIYFNDDVILGRRVWPDDYFTNSKGFKLYLAWQLPGCNPSCPNTWIKDGYCDKACNTKECEYDGGDCARTNATGSSSGGGGGSGGNSGGMAFIDQQASTALYYCSPGCATTWLADKYCDHACNTLNCSFDMGDCGISQVKSQLKSLNLVDLTGANPIRLNVSKGANKLEINIDKDQEWSANGFYLNMTSVHLKRTDDKEPEQVEVKIVEAFYGESTLIRAMSILNNEHVLLVLVMPRSSNQSASGSKVQLELKGHDSNDPAALFELTLEIDLSAADGLKWAVSAESLTTPAEPDSDEPAQPLHDLGLVNFDRLRPELPSDSSSPETKTKAGGEVTFKNNLFRLAYESYHEYLKWCIKNDFLTSEGLEYKLNLFYQKLNTDVSQSVDELLQRLKNVEWPVEEDAVTANATISDEDVSLVKLLFLDQSISPFSEYDRELLLKQFSEKSKASDASSDAGQRMKKLADISFRKRKLLDTFADSLRYVNRIYNQIYGYVARKVPAHMPHMIDRTIMAKLQEKFRDEFERTSGNRMRTTSDMQYSFSYYYFVIGESREFNASYLFREFDLNRNGLLDQSELNVIGMRLNNKPFSFLPQSSLIRSLTHSDSDRKNMYKLNPELKLYLDECAENYTNATGLEFKMDVENFATCEKLIEYLHDKFWPIRSDSATSSLEYNFRKNKYKYELLDEEETKFLMVGGNPYDIELKMNNLIREPVKFICLNDNIDPKSPNEAKKLRYLLKYFYRTLYPNKSSFERDETAQTGAEGTQEAAKSPFSSTSDWPAHFRQHYKQNPNAMLKLVIFVLVILVVAFIIRKILKQVFGSRSSSRSRPRTNSDTEASDDYNGGDYDGSYGSASLPHSSSIRLRPGAAPVDDPDKKVGILLPSQDSKSSKKLKKPTINMI